MNATLTISGPSSGSELGNHLIAVMVYSLLFLVGLSIRAMFGDEAWMCTQAVCGGAVFYLLWRKLDWYGNRILSFGAMLLITSFLNRILYAVDVVVDGSRLSEWPIPSNGEWWALARAEWMTVVGTIVVVYMWRYAGGAKSSSGFESSAADSRRDVGGYWLLYTCAVAIELLRQQGVLFNQVAQLATVTYASGLGAVLTLNNRHDPINKVFVRTAVMSAPLVYLALGTGMKEAIIIAILPLVIVYWRRFNFFGARIALVATLCLATALATNFVEYYRQRNWVSGETVSISEALRSYAIDGGTKNYGVEGGLQEFLVRNNATYHRGWAIDLAEQDGFIPEAIFGALAYAFIPRFVWPEKPDIEPGQEHSGRVFGEAYRLSSTSSTAAGFFPALYMGGGWLAVGLGALFTGWMIGFLTKVLVRTSNPYAISAFGWIMLLYALRFDETWPVYALSSPLISFVYVLALGVVVISISQFLGPPRASGGDRPGPPRFLGRNEQP